MPTYQYACTACDERLEAVQSFTDAPLTECPACGGTLRKVFSAVGVVFKGSGFYKTDSRGSKGGSKGDAATAGASSSTSTSSGDASSSSTPAPAAAPAAAASTSSAPASKTA